MTSPAPSHRHPTRRSALGQGAAGSLMLLSPVAASVLGGCSEAPAPDLRALVLTLQIFVIPYTGTPGASAADNADFVLRAIDAGMMNVSFDLLHRLSDDIARRGWARLTSLPPRDQARIVGELDAAVFALPAPVEHPWYATKALILMSYYTSEAGMSQELRYDLVPGRYDHDLIVGPGFRPLSNDWAAVSVKKKIAP